MLKCLYLGFSQIFDFCILLYYVYLACSYHVHETECDRSNRRNIFVINCLSAYKSVCKIFRLLQVVSFVISLLALLQLLFSGFTRTVDMFVISFPRLSIRFILVIIDAKRFSDCERLFLPKRLFSVCMKLKSLLIMLHEQAFKKLFLKFSDRKAYKIGFNVDAVYDNNEKSTKTTISSLVLQ